MKKSVCALSSLTLLFLLTGVLLVACSASQIPAAPTSGPISTPTNAPLPTNAPTAGQPATAAPTASQPTTTTLDGQTLLQERCTVCHSLDRVASKHKTADQWKATVERMVGNGAQLDAQERQTLIDYLAQTYP